MIGILGAGSIGTALAKHIGDNGYKVVVWDRDLHIVNEVNRVHVNPKYYPNILLPSNIKGNSNITDVIDESDIIFIALPSRVVADVLDEIPINKLGNRDIISLSKGFIRNKLFTEYFTEDYKVSIDRLGVISGPNFASEIINGKYTVTIVASKNMKLANRVKDILDSDSFRCIVSDDIYGTQYAGILKNVVAMLTGILEGMGINRNALAFLFSKSLSDTIKVARRIGLKDEKVLEIALVGDVILTSFSSESRNRTLGLLIGKNVVPYDCFDSFLIEGIRNISVLKEKLSEKGIEYPTLNALYDIVVNRVNPYKRILNLMDELT